MDENEETIRNSKAVTIGYKLDDWLYDEGDLDDFIFYGEEPVAKSER